MVDDEALVRMLAVDALRVEGFTVYEAADARETLSLMDRQGDVTLVVSDIDMPGMSGVELAREIGRRRPQVRFVLTSGRGCPDRLPPGGRFLAKPYTSAALSAQLRWPV